MVIVVIVGFVLVLSGTVAFAGRPRELDVQILDHKLRNERYCVTVFS